MEDHEKRVLDEMRSISSGLYSSFFGILIRLEQSKGKDETNSELEKIAAKMGLEISLPKSLPERTVPKIVLEVAMPYVSQLEEHAKVASPYVQEAVARHSRVVQNLLDTPDTLILDNFTDFNRLGLLFLHCDSCGRAYMYSESINLCLGTIFEAADSLQKFDGYATAAKFMGNDSMIKPLTCVADIFRTYLDLCKACPYMRYEREHRIGK
jgi:hypothetical protein